MARPIRPESALVSLGLEVTETDAARIDQVLARPEFAGWTRADWCLEIIRTALRFYSGRPVRDADPDRGAAAPAAAPGPQRGREPVPAVPEPPGQPELPGQPEPPGQPECAHPADARDYQTGTCAACGAILWD